MNHLRALSNLKNKKGPKSQKTLHKRADKILARYKAKDFIQVDIALEQVDQFRQNTKGPATKQTTYRKVTKWVPRVSLRLNQEAIDRDAAMDGIFPLVTNTDLDPVDVLKNYKYQPKLEKRHSLFKSVLNVAPVFLKKNDRIDALMIVYFITQLIAALIERQIHLKMEEKNIPAIDILPEHRPSKHPTTEQILRIFAQWSRYELYDNQKLIKTFTDPLNGIEKLILSLLAVPTASYS